MTDSREQRSTSSAIEALECNEADEQVSSAQSNNPARHILSTIETEILPRLMLVHQFSQNDNHSEKMAAEDIGPEHVEELVGILFERSVSAGQEYVEAALREGVDLEQVYMRLLAPAARLMGEMWETDARDFSDVTIGLCRLHEILRHHQLEAPENQIALEPDCSSVLLATACGDQHVFGVIMVAEFFRKSGWDVTSEPGASTDELKRIVRDRHFDIIGLSIARSLEAIEIAEEITQLRAASMNKNVKIIIGGALLEREASIMKDVNADGFSTDASKAPHAARNLLSDQNTATKGAAT